MQWIQDPSRSNSDNLNNVRRDASRHFSNKKKAYLKAKIEELEKTVRLRMSGTCIGSLMTSKRGTSLEVL
jgi:hypothetical protein